MKRFAGAVVALFGVSSVAFAADLPVKAPSSYMSPAPVASWSGFYGGVHGGWGWGDDTTWDVGGTVGTGSMSGGLVGGQIGYNWQVNSMLFGVQGDGSWANIKGTANNSLNLRDGRCGFAGLSDQTANCSTTIKGMGNLTARVGFLPLPDTLLYGKFGVNWSSIDFSVNNDVAFSGTCFNPALSHAGYNTTNKSVTGLTAGLGVEQRISGGLSVFGEYDVMQGSTSHPIMTGGTGASGCTANFTPSVATQPINIIKFGLNYQFGARY